MKKNTKNRAAERGSEGERKTEAKKTKNRKNNARKETNSRRQHQQLQNFVSKLIAVVCKKQKTRKQKTTTKLRQKTIKMVEWRNGERKSRSQRQAKVKQLTRQGLVSASKKAKKKGRRQRQNGGQNGGGGDGNGGWPSEIYADMLT